MMLFNLDWQKCITWCGHSQGWFKKKTRERERKKGKKREEKRSLFYSPPLYYQSPIVRHNNTTTHHLKLKNISYIFFFLFLVDFIVYLRFIQGNHSLPFVLNTHLSQFPVFSGPSLSLFRHGRSVLHYLVFFLLFFLYMHSTKFEYLVDISLCLVLFQLKWLLLPSSLRTRLLY